MVRAIGIETATSIASVGIVETDHVLAAQSLPKGGNHARALLPLIDSALHAAGIGLRDLDLVAVSIGPGSFTGLRIALSAAKGLALATGLPIVGVPTLEAYAATAGPRPGLVCPVLDARKGEIYAAAYQWEGADLRCVRPPVAIDPARFAASIDTPCTLIGDGVDAYGELWRLRLSDADLVPFSTLAPSGAVVARLGVARADASGTDDLADLEPFYCRVSEAELTHARRAAARQDPASQEGVPKLTGGRW